MIQVLKESYTYISQSVKVSTHAEQPVQIQQKTKLGNGNYNMEACTWGASHKSSGILYSQFCPKNRSKYVHTEIECKKKHNNGKTGSKADLS